MLSFFRPSFWSLGSSGRGGFSASRLSGRRALLVVRRAAASGLAPRLAFGRGGYGPAGSGQSFRFFSLSFSRRGSFRCCLRWEWFVRPR